MGTQEEARQAAQLQALRSQGEERTLRQADEASQKRLGEAIQRTAVLEHEAQEKRNA
jgi:hypothetical protein